MIDALFFPVTKGSEQRELAAYRLDTLLGFDLVPIITVERQIDGEPGVLQLAAPPVPDESQRARRKSIPLTGVLCRCSSNFLAVFDY